MEPLGPRAIVKAYQLMIRVQVDDGGEQEADDRAVEVAERIASELGARMVTVCEYDASSGEMLPIMAAAL